MNRSTVVLGSWACLLAACPPEKEPMDASVVLDASVPGNSCESAIPFELPMDGGVLALPGDATGFGDHASCSYYAGKSVEARGPDQLYRFSNTEPMVLDAHIDGGTLHLGTAACEFECPLKYDVMRDEVSFDLASLHIQLLPGEHTLFAESPGPYQLELSGRPLFRGDTCDDPLPLTPDAGPVRVDAFDYFDEAYPFAPLGCRSRACSASLYFVVNAAEPMGLRMAATTPDPSLKVKALGACGAPATVFDAAGNVLGAGPHVIGVQVLESTALHRSSYPLEFAFDLHPLADGDTCDTAIALDLQATDAGQATRTALVEGDSMSAFPSGGGTCGGARSNDLFFAFSLSTPSDLKAEVTTSSTTYQPALALRAGTCSGAEAACTTAVVPGAGATVTATALPAGDYWLSLRGVGLTSGPYHLQVDVTSR